jgi:hypothetical protein
MGLISSPNTIKMTSQALFMPPWGCAAENGPFLRFLDHFCDV